MRIHLADSILYCNLAYCTLDKRNFCISLIINYFIDLLITSNAHAADTIINIMIMESGVDFAKDSRNKGLKEIFLKLFKSNGYGVSNKFNKSVWFLSRDLEFINSLVELEDCKLNSTDEQYIRKNPILEIISKIVGKMKENSFISTGNDGLSGLNGFQIFVSDFIKDVCEQLIKSQNVIDCCQENINHYCAKEKLEVISKKIKDIDDFNVCIKGKEEKNKIMSSINIGLSRLDYLPEGDYFFRLVVKEIDSEFNVVRWEKPLLSSKKIKIINGGERLNLFEMNLNSRDINFPEVYINELNQEKFKEHTESSKLMMKTIIQKKVEVSLDNSQNQNENELQSKQKVVQSNSINRKNNKGKGRGESYVEEQSFFSSTLTLVPVDIDFNENSGTNILNFGVSIERNGEKFAESSESFLDFIILHLEEFMQVNREFFHSNYMSTVVVPPQMQAQLSLSNNMFNIILSLGLKTTQAIKKILLTRIYSIFNANITLKRHHEARIDFILSNYFPQIQSRVRSALVNPVESSDGKMCCSDCVIY